MIIINFWGPPNSGKSVDAYLTAATMKIKQYNVELVTEVAKDYTWEERTNILKDQVYILAKQNSRLERLRNKVNWVVTDSPLLMGVTYALPGYYSSLKQIALEIWNSYENINIYLQNITPLPYQTSGRWQSPAEAALQGEKIHCFLLENNIQFHTVTKIPHNTNPEENHIKDILKIIDTYK